MQRASLGGVWQPAPVRLAGSSGRPVDAPVGGVRAGLHGREQSNAAYGIGLRLTRHPQMGCCRQTGPLVQLATVNAL